MLLAATFLLSVVFSFCCMWVMFRWLFLSLAWLFGWGCVTWNCGCLLLVVSFRGVRLGSVGFGMPFELGVCYWCYLVTGYVFALVVGLFVR